METKPLLYGIIGFLLGGLVVSIAAKLQEPNSHQLESDMSMTQMVENLEKSVSSYTIVK